MKRKITVEMTKAEAEAIQRVNVAIEHGEAYSGDDGDAVQWFLQRCLDEAKW